MSNVRKMVDCIARSKEIFVGLEDSKAAWKVCVRAEREIIHQGSMPARYDALAGFLRNRFPDCTVHVVYEAGFRGFNLYFNLVADGYGCTVVPPHTVHQEKCSRVKNDRTDARLLAKNLEDGNCKACHIPDRERLADRQVVRDLNAVTKDIKRAKNQIRGFLYNHGICPAIKGVKWTDNQYRSLRYIETGSPRLRRSLDRYLDQFEFLLAQRVDLLKELRELSQKERYAGAFKIAESFPGIGRLTAIRLVLELGEDLQRFRSGREIASFVGLGGSEYSTGESIRRGGITKQGNGLIRSWLIESAWIAIRYDPALQVFYSRIKLNNGANSNKAIVAVARKLITRLRSCIVNNTTYVLGTEK